MVVIESHEENGVEWWLSFTSHNPELDECIQCPDKEFAFRMKELIDKFCVMKNGQERKE